MLFCGYRFKGWYLSSVYRNQIKGKNNSLGVSVETDMQLYAKLGIPPQTACFGTSHRFSVIFKPGYMKAISKPLFFFPVSTLL